MDFKADFVMVYSVLAVVFGIIALSVVSFWATNHDDTGFLGKASWHSNVFAWHPVFMVAGFFFCQVVAIVSWSLFHKGDNHNTAKIVHIFFQVAGMTTMIAGLCAVVKWKFDNKTPSLTTIHSWCGVGAVAVFGVNYVFGWIMTLLTKFMPDSPLRAYDLRGVHKRFGLVAFGLTTVAVLTGITNQLAPAACWYKDTGAHMGSADADPARHYHELPTSCKVANGLGILVTITALMVVSAVILRGQVDSEKKNETEVATTSQ